MWCQWCQRWELGALPSTEEKSLWNSKVSLIQQVTDSMQRNYKEWSDMTD